MSRAVGIPVVHGGEEVKADTPFPYSPPSQNPGADSHTELVGPADTDEPETVMVGEPQATGGSGPTESWIG